MVWEVLEFGGDAAFGLTWQVDNADTMNDIICGIVGASARCRDQAVDMAAQPTGHRPTHPLPALPRPRPARGGRKGRAGRRDGPRRARATGLPGLPGLGHAACSRSPGGADRPVGRGAPRPATPVAYARVRPADPGPGRASGTAVQPTRSVVASVPIPSIGGEIPVGADARLRRHRPERQVRLRRQPRRRRRHRRRHRRRTRSSPPSRSRTGRRSTWRSPRTARGSTSASGTSADGRSTGSPCSTPRRTRWSPPIPVRSSPFLRRRSRRTASELYVPNHDSGTVSVDRHQDEHRWSPTSGCKPNPHWVEFSTDGTRAYTANHESNLVSVIDTATDTVVGRGPGASGARTAWRCTRPGRCVADANYDCDSVTMIDTELRAGGGDGAGGRRPAGRHLGAGRAVRLRGRTSTRHMSR